MIGIEPGLNVVIDALCSIDVGIYASTETRIHETTVVKMTGKLSLSIRTFGSLAVAGGRVSIRTWNNWSARPVVLLCKHGAYPVFLAQ